MRHEAWGIDNDDNLYIWGNDISWLPASETEGVADLVENRNFTTVPVKFTYFVDKNLKVIDIKAGWNMAVALVEDRSNGERFFYGIGK